MIEAPVHPPPSQLFIEKRAAQGETHQIQIDEGESSIVVNKELSKAFHPDIEAKKMGGSFTRTLPETAYGAVIASFLNSPDVSSARYFTAIIAMPGLLLSYFGQA
jgi:hypothetical protein